MKLSITGSSIRVSRRGEIYKKKYSMVRKLLRLIS
jgi:hypothetical protein